VATTDPTPTTDTFIFADVPRTAQDQVESSITDFSTRAAKLAVLAYIKEFIDGRFQHVMRALAARIETFTTDTIPATADQERHYLMLARKMALLYQHLPAIVVVDSGTTMNQPGIGSYDKSEQRDGQIYLRQNRILDIPLEVIVGAAREDTCDDIFDGVLTMFENRMLVGSTISGSNWVVTLPLTYSQGARTTQPMPDDQTGSQVFAIRSLTFTPRFELWYYHTVNRVTDPNLHGMADRPHPPRRFNYPPRVRITHGAVKVQAFNYPVGTVFRSDRSDIALFTPDLYIVPKQLGTCRLLATGPHEEFKEEYPLTVTL
jgi:hypothetical protein